MKNTAGSAGEAMIACIRDGEIAFRPVKGRFFFGDMG